MRKLLSLFLALALSACATVHNIDTALALANQNVANFTIADDKGWYYAEALYNVPTQAYLSANRRGLLHDPLKSQLKHSLQSLNVLRGDVYQAYKAGNSVSFREKIVQLKALSDQIRNQIPGA